MRIATIPENPLEWLALRFGRVPTPLCDVLVGPMLARAVIAASALHVFDALERKPLTAVEVADLCGTDPGATERLLRALSASKYLNQDGGTYRLTLASRRWLLRGSRQSLHYAMLHRDLDMRFMDFESYVRTGKGKDFHDELGDGDWHTYHQGQADQARLIAKDLVGSVRIPDGSTRMLDLGGGHGLYSVAFCTRYPDLQARVLDLAIPVSATSVSNRVKFEVADVRSAALPPSSTHIALVANLIHHFDEQTNRRLFKRVAAALTSGGILVALDLVRPPPDASGGQISALMDLYFGAASGSQLWTLDQIRAWQTESGLRPGPAVSLHLLPDCKIQIARKP
jgi:SAM-dependent methyltransferase